MAFKYASNYYDFSQFFSIASKPNRLNLFNNFTFTYKFYPMYMFYLIGLTRIIVRESIKNTVSRGVCRVVCITV